MGERRKRKRRRRKELRRRRQVGGSDGGEEGRELEELVEEGGEVERDADSWVESTEGEGEEGGRAKDTLEGMSDRDTARGPRPSR